MPDLDRQCAGEMPTKQCDRDPRTGKEPSATGADDDAASSETILGKRAVRRSRRSQLFSKSWLRHKDSPRRSNLRRVGGGRGGTFAGELPLYAELETTGLQRFGAALPALALRLAAPAERAVAHFGKSGGAEHPPVVRQLGQQSIRVDICQLAENRERVSILTVSGKHARLDPTHQHIIGLQRFGLVDKRTRVFASD